MAAPLISTARSGDLRKLTSALGRTTQDLLDEVAPQFEAALRAVRNELSADVGAAATGSRQLARRSGNLASSAEWFLERRPYSLRGQVELNPQDLPGLLSLYTHLFDDSGSTTKHIRPKQAEKLAWPAPDAPADIVDANGRMKAATVREALRPYKLKWTEKAIFGKKRTVLGAANDEQEDSLAAEEAVKKPGKGNVARKPLKDYIHLFNRGSAGDGGVNIRRRIRMSDYSDSLQDKMDAILANLQGAG